MTEWLGWFVLAGVLVILEMFTGTFYLLMIAFGAVAGGMVAFAGLGGAAQLTAAAIVGVIATFGLRRSKWGKTTRRNVVNDPNLNLDIGQTLVVNAWHGKEGERRTARAMYRGALWDVELEKGSVARPGTFVIHEVRGSRLIVANNASK